MGRHIQYADLSLAEFKKRRGCTSRFSTTRSRTFAEADAHAPVLGQHEGPHHCDVAARRHQSTSCFSPGLGISFEAANPRHAHEWNCSVGKGAEARCSSRRTRVETNYHRHPELIARASAATPSSSARENVVAGATAASAPGSGRPRWIRTWCGRRWRRMAEGARLATREF